MKKKLIIGLVIMLSLTMLMTGCKGEDKGLTQTTGDAADETGAAVRTDFTIAIPSEPKALDPHNAMDSWTSAVLINVFDCLVQLDDNGNVLPSLAKEWEVREDGLSIRFLLRDDVKFHDGSDFTAADVKFSFERAMGSSYKMGATNALKNVEILNDYEVVINLNYKYAPILNLIANSSCSIVSKAATENIADEDFLDNAVGTGPYKFVEWKKGDRIILEAFDNYYDGTPSIKDVTYSITTLRKRFFTYIEPCDVDAYVDIAGIDRQTVLNNPDLKLLDTPSGYRLFLQMNNLVEPFDNKLVRQAIRLCFDQQEIIDIALDGAGVPADIALIHPNLGVLYGRMDKPQKNIEEAKKLLAEAGYPNGFDTVLHVREDATKVVGQILQENLAEIGINAEVVVVDRSAHLEDIINGTVVFSTLQLLDSLLDAGEPLAWDHSKNYGYNGGNFNYTTNDDIDRLVEAQDTEVDQAKRSEIITELTGYIFEESPYAPVYYPLTNIAFNINIKGLEAADSRFMYRINRLSW